jgi:pyridoxal phosphate enzyme (YggS family)
LVGFEYIKNNLDALKSEIKELSAKYGNEVTLVCVTKSGSDEELCALAEYGASDIGENRPQELKRRGELLAESGYTPALHEIGNLQRNKVKMIAEKVALIHSLDSYELALEIDKRACEFGRVIPVLIEVNSAEEEQKGGILPEVAEEFCKKISALEGISVRGLMTMAPRCETKEEYLKYFGETKALFDELFKNDDTAILSMGMSESYEYAIESGATLVRVGSKIFGERKY